MTWGTGPGVIAPFVDRVREAAKRGLITFRFRHRVDEVTKTGAVVDGVRGVILAPSNVDRGRKSSRDETGSFELKAQAVIVASGGIGANHDLVRRNWPQRLGKPPTNMITGVPDHVDGRMLGITESAGGTIINRDRMWHYVEGIKNWESDLDQACDPHSARAVVAVARCARQTVSGAALSRLRYAGHAEAHHADGLRLFVVHPDEERSSKRNLRFPVRSKTPISPARAGAR